MTDLQFNKAVTNILKQAPLGKTYIPTTVHIQVADLVATIDGAAVNDQTRSGEGCNRYKVSFNGNGKFYYKAM